MHYISSNYRKNHFYFVHLPITSSKLIQTMSLTFLNFTNLHLLNAFRLFLYIFRFVLDDTSIQLQQERIQKQVVQTNNVLISLLEQLNRTQTTRRNDQRIADHLMTTLCTTVDALKMSLHELYLIDTYGNAKNSNSKKKVEAEHHTTKMNNKNNKKDKEDKKDNTRNNYETKQEDNKEEMDNNVHYTEALLRIPSYQEDEDDYSNLFMNDANKDTNNTSSTNNTTTNNNTSNIVQNLVETILSNDIDGRNFWSTNIGINTYQIAWSDFISKLKIWLVIEDETKKMLLTQDMICNLKMTLDPSESGMVNIYRFSALLEGFGPSLKTSLQKMTSTLKETWFHGFLTYDESIGVLVGKEIGMFLFLQIFIKFFFNFFLTFKY